MKKLFFSVALLAMVASCSKNEVLDNGTSSENQIGFSTLNSSVTRSANESKSNYTVYAQYTTSGDNDSVEKWYIDDYEIDGVTDSPVNNKSYSWPIKSLSFYAFAPSSVVETGVKPSYGHGSLNIDYTVPDNAKEDFTVATPVDKIYDPLSTSVSLKFNHLLSKIKIHANINSQITDEYMLVAESQSKDIKVEFNALLNKGTVDVIAETPVLTVGSSSPATYTDPITILERDNMNNIGTSVMSYYIMPHSSNEGCVVTITGLGIQKATNGVAAVGSAIKPITLTHTFKYVEGSNITLAFKPNYQYDIVFLISLDDIKFSSEIVDWAADTTLPL